MGSNTGKPATVIVGLGDTGLSVAKYLASTGDTFKIVDSRLNPPGLAELRRLLPQAEIELGEFKLATFQAAHQLIVSPGISLKTPAIVAARKAGAAVSGDIDIFAKRVAAPIIAITGSNGKSTVTALVAEILLCANASFGLGGNLDGVNFKPALNLLQEGEKQFYVLELSSFQLETTERLNAAVAVILNISPDHMDRYENLDEYRQAKQRIFLGCQQAVVNRDDISGHPQADLHVPVWTFGTGAPGARAVGIVQKDGEAYFATREARILPVRELKIIGQHNVLNALAAMALTLAVGIDEQSIATALREFKGLPHRCQWVARKQNVDYYNDSKGTNVGATMTAIQGLGQGLSGRIVLIAGGIAKGADFSLLVPVVKRWVKSLILIGQDAKQIAALFSTDMQIEYADDMDCAVRSAQKHAKVGDAVLLSPACASFDMFDNFQHRGQMFVKAVEKL